MSLNAGPLGVEVAELMEELERDYGGDAKLTVAVAVVEVRYTDKQGDRCTSVHVAGLGSAPRSRVIGALFRAQGVAAWDQLGEDTD